MTKTFLDDFYAQVEQSYPHRKRVLLGRDKLLIEHTIKALTDPNNPLAQAVLDEIQKERQRKEQYSIKEK